MQTTDLTDTAVWPRWRRRDLPFRPYLHARIPRITVVEQLPQMMMVMMMMIDDNDDDAADDR